MANCVIASNISPLTRNVGPSLASFAAWSMWAKKSWIIFCCPAAFAVERENGEDWLICRQSTLMRHLNKFERSDIFHRRQQQQKKKQKLKQICKGNLLLKRCQTKWRERRTFTAVDRNCLASDQKVFLLGR